MCIRDSFYDTIKGGDYRAREGNVHRLAEVSNAIIDQCVAPVSYTHLRAHETVLDLVCRLLLETKQNRTS